MKKSARYITICITAFFLSFGILFVSLGLEEVYNYISHSSFTFGGGGTVPTSYTYYSVDSSSSDFPPTFTNYYVDFDAYNDGYVMIQYSTNPTIQLSINYPYYTEDYNTFDTISIVGTNTSSWYQRLYFSYFTSNRWFNDSVQISKSDLNKSSPLTINSSYGATIYCSWSSISVPGPTGNTSCYKVSFYGDIPIRLTGITNTFSGYSGYSLVPIYKVRYSVMEYTEWEKEQKEMHQQTLNEISQIGDDVSRVGDEVSKIGDEISQFHTDLTSYDESDAPDINDYNMSENIDTMTSFDTDISNFIDDNNGFTSYDYDTELSSIGDNFSWDEVTDGDISFWEFVVSLWSVLHMREIIVVFVPLAFVYVILKFVIGGII